MFVALSKQSMLSSFEGILEKRGAAFCDAKVVVTATKILKESFFEPLHFHENAHLNFVLSGGVIDKRQKSETEILAGELMFFHAGEPHQTIYKRLPQINISFEISEDFFTDKSFGAVRRIENLGKNLNTKFFSVKIYRELAIQDEFSESSIEMLVLNMLSAETAKFRPNWLDKVIELLNDNWDKPISLNDLAKAANVYPTTISKHFPKYVSCTLGEYRRRLKVEKSLNFIKTSNQSLTEIAYQCGFADQSHFTRTFKQLTDFLPNQYQAL